MDIGGEQAVLRPSLCPHHALIDRSRARSYRDLPLRMAELGGMYRAELSGVLGGLTRVRAIQLNDAHIFCAPDQVAAESGRRARVDQAGLRSAPHRAGPVPAVSAQPGRQGDAGGRDMWDRAAGLLEQVLGSAGVPYEAEEGEAAFYGPKIDVQIADSAEREASLSTVQVDFYLPERFGRTHRRRRGQAPPGDGAPQRHRQCRASGGPSHRRARRGLPRLARAGAAGGAAGRRCAVAGGRRACRAGGRTRFAGRGGPA